MAGVGGAGVDGAGVDGAFERVRRADFLPGGSQDRASDDAPVQIGGGQTNSQPSTVRRMLELLDVRRGQRVLDVGAGSGWTTALLALLVGSDGVVLGLELDREIARWGAANLDAQDTPWAGLEEAAAQTLGAPDRGPWNRILVSAEASSVPGQLVDQLASDGVMVIPVDGELTRVSMTDGHQNTSTHGPYRFVPLRGSWKG